MFGREPVAIAGALRAVILCATAFGWELTGDQVAAIMLAVEAVLTVITRQSVTSSGTLADAGLTKQSVQQQGEIRKDIEIVAAARQRGLDRDNDLPPAA